MADTEADAGNEDVAPVTTKSKWDPHLPPFNPHQGITPPGYDESKSPFDPQNVDAMRRGFQSYPDEPYSTIAMLAGQHFGALERSPHGFSAPHFKAVFWGSEGDPSEKSVE
jgi:hypothetical protein